MNLIDKFIREYYQKHGGRVCHAFLRSEEIDGWIFLHYLIDRKHVVRYGFGEDRGIPVGGFELAIGPQYFGPADFWSSDNFWRFSNEVTPDGIEKNLLLLDEFWGYEWPRPKPWEAPPAH